MDEDQVFLPDTAMSDQVSIGSCTGDFELDDIIKNTISLVKIFYSSKTNNFDEIKVIVPNKNKVKIFGYFQMINR